jgi:FkbM family methyltransferase
MKKFSQSDEEIFILEKYKDRTTGKFIDIGAYHIERFSNVRALFEKGWTTGVLVEPQPSNYKAIADGYANEKNITVLNLAIGDGNKEIDFYESNGDAVGTTDIGHMKKWGDAGVQYTKIKVPQMDVVEFMEQYAKDADFISVDTEATNMVIFRKIPDWVFERISLFCIEHDGCYEEIEENLSRFGFSTLYQNAENILLGK